MYFGQTGIEMAKDLMASFTPLEAYKENSTILAKAFMSLKVLELGLECYKVRNEPEETEYANKCREAMVKINEAVKDLERANLSYAAWFAPDLRTVLDDRGYPLPGHTLGEANKIWGKVKA